MNVPEPFQYYEVRPQLLESGKRGRYVAKTDLMIVEVQVSAPDGGETNLHSHPALDGSWLVLQGKARFYTEGDKDVATLGPYEGLVVPRGTMYWFECASEENLVIIRHAARDPNEQTQRIDGKPRVDNKVKVKEGQYFGQ
jgi:quercetin dioxygenase-like cupin family protein